MNNRDKVIQLRDKIYEAIQPMVNSDFVYLDVPHHFNSGDTLIWEGTLEFIKHIPYACKYIANANSYSAEKALKWCQENSSSATILLHGGGNFGDLWPLHQLFRNDVVSKCQDIPTIVLPQTIYYQDEVNLERDALLYSDHPNVTICVRDNISLEFAKKYFPNNNPTLVPDMAFCMDIKAADIPKPTEGSVFVKRDDKELSKSVHYDVPKNAVISDWPTMSEEHPLQNLHPSALDWCDRIDCRLGTHLRDRFINYYWNNEIRPRIVESAVSFIGKYQNVYTTRMHAAILSVILNRDKIVLFDNSYGKSSSFADAWFKDLDNFTLYR